MKEYLDNGTRLGWLINPKDKRGEIYRQNQEVQILDNPRTLPGEDVLYNFTLDLSAIWDE